MNQDERRLYLINYLLDEQPRYRTEDIPRDVNGQKRLLRALMNVRAPMDISSDFINVQDDYLRDSISEKGIVSVGDLQPLQEGIYLWQGDITRLSADAVVNAANSGLTGCYQPNHTCIDNCIHTYAGVQLRLACSKIMEKQGHEEPTGSAKITPAFNLPCKYVLHTVGPIVNGALNEKHCRQLEACYLACLELAQKNGCRNIAFCCISTGVFRFPNNKAAQIAVSTVREYRKKTGSKIEVIFNVFKDGDYEIYYSLLKS